MNKCMCVVLLKGGPIPMSSIGIDADISTDIGSVSVIQGTDE